MNRRPPLSLFRAYHVREMDRALDNQDFAAALCHLVNDEPSLPPELRTALIGLSGLTHPWTGRAEHEPNANHAGAGAPTHTWTGTGSELWVCALAVAGLHDD